MGIEPTTSGLDLPLLCRLSYELRQRKSGTIEMVNRGEVSHHLNRPRLSLSDLVGSIPTEVKRFFVYLVWFPDSLY